MSYEAKLVKQPDLVVITLEEGDARELADYLSGTDMHMSIGDRASLARVIRNAMIKEDQNDDY